MVCGLGGGAERVAWGVEGGGSAVNEPTDAEAAGVDPGVVGDEGEAAAWSDAVVVEETEAGPPPTVAVSLTVNVDDELLATGVEFAGGT